MTLGIGISKNAGAQSEPKSDFVKPTTSLRPFPGLLVEELSPALAGHLPVIVSPEHGLVIQAVTPDSPAAKAGLQPHDVLFAYDDQKLFVPEQFTRFVRNDQPGRIVKLEVIRAGKAESVSVTLGQRPESPQKISRRGFTTRRPGFAWAATRERPFRGAMAWPLWKSFDEVTVRKLDGHQFLLTLGQH